MNCRKIFLFITIAMASGTIQSKMRLHTGYTQLFERDPVITEYTAYQLLGKQPLDADVNYLALPWAVLINTNNLDKVSGINLNGGFTICQHISFERILPILKCIGIDTLFTPHVPCGKNYDGITVLPFPHYPVNGTDPAVQKDILYSFVGCTATHGVRKQLMQLPQANDVVLVDRSSWHFGRRSKKDEKREYQDVLARSRYSLCPRGTGASTIRFWESMQAGAIPVLISDAMTLPPEVDWSSCMIQISQDQVHLVDEIIRSIPVQVEEQLRANCLATFKLFNSDNFVRTIRCHYDGV